jgi:uncharacterized Zn finger protein (UPF0148 family)
MTRVDVCPNCGSSSHRSHTGGYCQNCGQNLRVNPRTPNVEDMAQHVFEAYRNQYNATPLDQRLALANRVMRGFSSAVFSAQQDVDRQRKIQRDQVRQKRIAASE